MIDKNYSIESIIRYITTGLGIVSESVSVKNMMESLLMLMQVC